MFLRQFAPKGNEEEQLFDSISGKKKKGLACYYGSPRDPRRRLAACPSDITCLRCSSAGGRSPAGQGTGCCALTGSRQAELGAAGAPAHEASHLAPPAQGISRGRAARVPPRVGSQAGAKPEPRQTATEKGAGHSQGPAPMGWGTATAPKPLCHEPQPHAAATESTQSSAQGGPRVGEPQPQQVPGGGQSGASSSVPPPLRPGPTALPTAPALLPNAPAARSGVLPRSRGAL